MKCICQVCINLTYAQYVVVDFAMAPFLFDNNANIKRSVDSYDQTNVDYVFESGMYMSFV